MVWSQANIAGDELDAFNLDRPILLGAHELRSALDGAPSEKWLWTQTGATTDTDETDASYPAERAFDGFGHLDTRPDSSELLWYYVAAVPSIEFDSVLLMGNNLTGATDIFVEISDTGASWDPVVWFNAGNSYATGEGPLANRMAHCNLKVDVDGPIRLTGVDQIRIKFEVPGPATYLPELTEFWVGRRRQLLHQPNAPFDSLHDRAELSLSRARCGLTARQALNRAKSIRRPRFTTGSDAEADVLTDFWADCRQGSRSWLWIEDPATDPDAYIMTPDENQANFDPALFAANRRELELVMAETHPHLLEDG